jgi:exportin-2 (importin alpha re-exporter)
MEYIRVDLAVSSAGLDNASRRQAAADVLRSLVSGGHEAETTDIVGSFINADLDSYQANKTQNWKAKDRAIFMLTAAATKGSTTKVSQSITSFCLY